MTDDELVAKGKRIAQSGKYAPKAAAAAEGNGHDPGHDIRPTPQPEPPADDPYTDVPPPTESDWPPIDSQPTEAAPLVVDGVELLRHVEHFAGRFLAFPTRHHLVVLCLWIVHTWAVSAFYVTPRLVLDSPEPGSGKTRVLEVLALLCRGARLTLSTTTAALYRRIAAAGDEPPTVLQDEADAVFGRTTTPQAEDLRALFNAGYKRGATVDRCEGDAKNMKVRQFPVFAPVALAGLAGRMPATITDRAIPMHMRRRASDEHVAEFRERDAALQAAPLREQLEVWATANVDALSVARPMMPDGVRDRAAEVWESLLAIADVVGAEWPERARAACRHFVVNAEPDALSLGLRLLTDIHTAFGDRDRMFSVDLVAALMEDPESEWSDLWGKPLNQARLAKELKRYGVSSKQVRVGGSTAKGYLVEGDDGLAQAWHRYLPDVSKRNTGNTGNTAGKGVSLPEQRGNRRNRGETPETASEQGLFDSVSDVSDVSPTDGVTEDAPFEEQPGSANRRACPCGRAGPVHAETGLCYWCEVKASKAPEEA
jgi:hypothetical protein